MFPCLSTRLITLAVLVSSAAPTNLLAQEPSRSPLSEAAPATQATANCTAPAPNSDQVAVPTGTRLPLLLRNGINSRTAKAGDSVYFETEYPIAQNNRIVIPMGSFVRGRILESKRPGLIKGRGEFRMVLEQMTFPNGYTVSLGATPASADRDGREGVDAEGKIVGPSGSGRDKMLALATTAGGAYIGTLAGTVASGAPAQGAWIGGGAGAAAGLIAILLTRGPEAELPRGTILDVVFDHQLILDLDRLPANDPGRLSQPFEPPTSQKETHRRERPRGRTLPGWPFPFLHF
ncbi:MAG: hypothetical protein DMG49_11250 [Acidobacteria bacterium]|nr:MAG: hypothetical protein DMG49_11250 [Acidobacteriota bacterium]